MGYNNLPAPRMSGDNIASCVGSAAQAFTALVVVGGLVYTAIKIGVDRIKIKRKDTELEMSKGQGSNTNQQTALKKL